MSNARAARRRAEKEAKKAGTFVEPKKKADGPTIVLQNPHSEHFPQFVIGNALAWEAMAHDELIRCNREAAESLEPYWGLMALMQAGFNDRPAFEAWQRFRDLVAEHCPDQFVVYPDSAKGKHVVICGAGPSLAEEAAEWIPQADEVWGCNSALPWLHDNGYKVTHGLTVDQTEAMIGEWKEPPDVEYMLASTVHPELTKHLREQKRRIRWFHNFVGMRRDPVQWPDSDGVEQLYAYEDWLYILLYPGTVRAGSGLNTVTRAIDVALCMGFEKITVLGADCALRVKSKSPPYGTPEHAKWLEEETVMHADGGNALASGASAVTLGAEIDSGTPDETVRPGHGRWWESKIDLLISARWLLVLERHHKGRIRIVGDTYVAALRGKNKAFLERLPALTDQSGNDIEITVDTGFDEEVA